MDRSVAFKPALFESVIGGKLPDPLLKPFANIRRGNRPTLLLQECRHGSRGGGLECILVGKCLLKIVVEWARGDEVAGPGDGKLCLQDLLPGLEDQSVEDRGGLGIEKGSGTLVEFREITERDLWIGEEERILHQIQAGINMTKGACIFSEFAFDPPGDADLGVGRPECGDDSGLADATHHFSTVENEDHIALKRVAVERKSPGKRKHHGRGEGMDRTIDH